jgi:FkbM family methyltransferase
MLELGIHPVLVDVGASAGPPAIWSGIAPHSVYVGFDPDLREFHEASDSVYRSAVTVNEAVVADPSISEVPVHLTRSPQCSSTLAPDGRALSNYLFSDLFVVEQTARVRASSLDSVIDRLSLRGIDWLKTDSQGTDLRIVNSLCPQTRSHVLAVDIEPGLIDAYVGEDLFVDAHRDLVSSGYWLSNIKVCGAVRMRQSTCEALADMGHDLSREHIERRARSSPGWCEARYLRTLEWLAGAEFEERDYVLLWVFALLDQQVGFSLDTAIAYGKRFGEGRVSQSMVDESLRILARSEAVSTGGKRHRGLRFRIARWLGGAKL